MSEYSVTIEKLRPTGYEFPVGNNTKDVGSQPDSYFDSLGGTKTFSGDYVIHTFTSSGTFKDYTGTAGHDCEFFIIAGGGGGGAGFGGGGGAGGFRYGTDLPVSVNDEYAVVIGSGGQGSLTPQNPNSPGNDSEISNINLAPHTQANSTGHIFADGGGQGGNGGGGGGRRHGMPGGCGGGGGGAWDAQGGTEPNSASLENGSFSPPAAPQGITNIYAPASAQSGHFEGAAGMATPAPEYVFSGGPGAFRGYGYPGGFGKGRPNTIPGLQPYSPYGGGGGGGIGSIGKQVGFGPPTQGGYGGDGLEYSISGSPVFYGGGGAGHGYSSGGSAPMTSGGGDHSKGRNGLDNRGGGGGGNAGANPGNEGGNGGSGVVIIRYAKTGLTGYEVN